jgi:hypothetical protein
LGLLVMFFNWLSRLFVVLLLMVPFVLFRFDNSRLGLIRSLATLGVA